MVHRCHIALFGGLRLIQESIDGQRTTIEKFRTQKAAALLAFLALHLRQSHAREYLLELFWSLMDEAAGRDNLSAALTSLRKQLELPGSGVPASQILVADRLSVRLNPEFVTTDVQEFESRLKSAERSDITPEDRLRLLTEAIALYRGELLPGFYDDWVLTAQGRLAERFADALEKQGAVLLQVGQREAALAAYSHCITVDPLREEVHQARMRLLCALGRPIAAREAYAEFVRYLDKAVGATPSPATRRLIEQIERDPESFATSVREASTPPVPASSPPAAVAPPPGMPPSTRRVHLPLRLASFIGRATERQAIGASLVGSDASRLVTLTGPGGAGKTRLAVETAEEIAEYFPGGVWFVSLADIPNPAFLVAALTNAMQLSPGGGDNPVERIIGVLTEVPGPYLLVLDNFEHLLGSRLDAESTKSDNPALHGPGALLRLLLARIPDLSLLITSRQALCLGGEQVIPLGPLALTDFPEESPDWHPSDSELEALRNSAAIALFVNRARAVQPDFALTTRNAASVAAICRLLDGMPLALEMAAAWIKTIPPARMRERLERGVSDLASRRRDLPPRHQSLHNVAEWSYRLLEPELQRLFRRLSVFSGGWTLEHAEALFPDDDVLGGLADLQDRSLVYTVEAGEDTRQRYRMLVPLREFAAEMLQEAAEGDTWRERHAVHFCSLALEAKPHLDGAGQVEWLKVLEAEQANLRIALDFHLDRTKSDTLRENGLMLCAALFRYWLIRGYRREGLRWCVKAFEETADLPPILGHARVANVAGHMHLALGEYDEAKSCFQDAHDRSEALGDRTGIAVAFGSLALLYLRNSDPAASRMYGERSLAIQRELGNHLNVALSLSNIAYSIMQMNGDLDEAIACREEALGILRQLGNQTFIASQLNGLGIFSHMKGDNAAARIYFTEALELNRQLENPEAEAHNHYALGELALRERDFTAARRYYTDALTLWNQVANPGYIATALEAFARAEIGDSGYGDWERAVRLFGAADALRNGPQKRPLLPEEAAEHAEAVSAMVATLGKIRFDALFESGRNLTCPQAITLALSAIAFTESEHS